MPIPAPAFFAKMSETQRLITSVAVIVGVGGTLAVFWILGLKEAGALSKDVGSAKAALKAAQKTLDDFPDLQRRQRETLSEDRRLSQLLPDQAALDQAYELLGAIEEQAGKSGNEPEFTLSKGKAVIKPAQGKPGPQNVEEFTVELEALGTWGGFVSFLDGVEHADRLMTVKSFKTTGNDKTTGLPTYKIVLSVYVMAAAQGPGAKR